jgi:hypothetical protein
MNDAQVPKSMLSSILFVPSSGKKKARTFDFMAMFEETRKTAMERSQKVFGEIYPFQNKTSSETQQTFMTLWFFKTSIPINTLYGHFIFSPT